METLVFGAGSLGSLLGGLLARTHDVTLVGREPHVAAIRESGLLIDGAVEERVWPAARTDAEGVSADLAVVAVKSYDTPAAASALADVGADAVLSVQNGLGNEAILAERCDGAVLAGTATYGAELAEPGRVTCTGRGTVTLGPPGGGDSRLADRVGDAFTAAGIDTAASASMPERRWEKLAVNAGINPVTALARVRNGELRGGPSAELARSAARETARVAQSEGVTLTPDDAVAALDRVVEDTAANRSSTLQDVRAGRRTEIDALNGAVCRHARERGLDVPVNETLATLLRAWERGRGLREE